MANVEEVKVHVAASVDQTQQAVLALSGVSQQLDEALARLRLTALGAAHPSVLTAIAQLEQARSRLDEAATLARSAADSAAMYRSIV